MRTTAGNRATLGWQFWFQWVLASSVGMFIGFLVGFFLVSIISGQGSNDASSGDGSAFFIALTVAFTLAGAGMGFMQWLVIRRKIPKAGWWILASALGFAIVAVLYGLLSDLVSEVVNEVVHNSIGGAVTGVMQWLILRRQVYRAGWWVLASSLGLVVAGAVSNLLGGGPINMVVGIATMAAITGGVLIWLLNRSISQTSDTA